MNHIWQKQRVACVNKQNYAVSLQNVIFQKSQNLLTEHLYERQPIHNIQYYSLNFNGGVM